MKNPTVFLILSVLFFSIDGLAQGAGSGIVPVLKTAVRYDGSEKFTVGEVNGTVKTKAVYLPKPLYPDEARRAGVEGTVRVQISIDEQGNVRLLEPVHAGQARRALVIILDEQPKALSSESAVSSEAALARDWDRPEENAAWSHLQRLP